MLLSMVALFHRPASIHEEVFEEHLSVVRDTADTLRRLGSKHHRAQQIRRSLDLFLSDIAEKHCREKSADTPGVLSREFIFHWFQTQVTNVLSSLGDSDASSIGGETERKERM